jgi:hypothetical protein
MVSAEATLGASLTAGKQRTLFSVAPFLRPGPIPSYSMSPDGTLFLMVREGDAAQSSELILADNWGQQLQARAPKEQSSLSDLGRALRPPGRSATGQ